MADIDEFLAARDFMRHRDDYATAYGSFRWPAFDAVQLGARLLSIRIENSEILEPALWIVDDAGAESRLSSSPISPAARTSVANFLRRLRRPGVAR